MNNIGLIIRKIPYFAWLWLFYSGIVNYPGSKLIFGLFSLVSILMLLVAIRTKISYGYIFLSIFLWLGLWFKLAANYLLLGFFPFGEPVGGFDSSPAAWDQVLVVATAACSGLLFSSFPFVIFQMKSVGNQSFSASPAWYAPNRIWLWAMAATAIIAIAWINLRLGIHQVGIVPRTILHWPLNAFIGLFLNVGAVTLVSVLVCWDVSLKKSLTSSVLFIFAEGLVTSVSCFTRAGFVFHALPQLVALYFNGKISESFTPTRYIIILIIFVFLLFLSIGSVSSLRDSGYRQSLAVKVNEKFPIASESTTTLGRWYVAKISPNGSTPSFRILMVHQLIINRWIGLEGIMAISSYPQKSMGLLLNMFNEKRRYDTVDHYQIISKSGYQTIDPSFKFATVPGVAGFLFYSNSVWFVFIGIAIIGVLMVATEKLAFVLTSNPLLCSIYGVTIANIFAQYGVAPRQDIPMFIVLFSIPVLVWMIQSGFSSLRRG